MSEGNINILMTGAGAPGAAGILKCLFQNTNIHVVAADANFNAVGKHLVDDFVTIPFAQQENFIEVLLSVCREKSIHVLLPLVTRELIPLALHVKEFKAAGTKLLVSSPESLEIANNKSRLYQFLEWRGIKLPAYRVVETIDQFETAVKELGYPEKEICFKPSVSNGSRGFRIISNKIHKLDLLLNHKPDSSYISLEEAIQILSSGKFPELLVSEFLPGDEYSVDCLVNQGETIMAVSRLRKRMINGISVEGEFIKNDSIVSYCKKIISELKLHGNIGLQVKQSAAGTFLLLEINPRVQGTISAALGAGVNLPLLAVKQELGLTITPEELEVTWGTKFSRYWTEVFY
jgi:carbamoyl-phosphate synthase large subunit